MRCSDGLRTGSLAVWVPVGVVGWVKPTEMNAMSFENVSTHQALKTNP